MNLSIPLCRQELTGIQILLPSLFPVAQIEHALQRDSNETRAQMHQKKIQQVTTATPNEDQTKDFHDVKSLNLVNNPESP